MTETQERMLRAIESRQDELYDLLCRLVRVDSQSFGSTGREKAMAELVADELRSLGLEPDVYSPEDIPGFRENPDYLPGRHLENRPNVTAVLPGAGEKKLCLMGHSDTVPVGDPASWTVEPFAGMLRDGAIWGRGSTDDKYAIAAVLFLMRLMRDEGISLPYTLLFTAYCDEEAGGSHGALASVLRYPVDDIVNLDCKNFEIWKAASGGGCMDIRFRAKTPQDSCLSVIPGLTAVTEALEAFRERRKTEFLADPVYADTVIPHTAMRIMEAGVGSGGCDMDKGHVSITFYTRLSREEFASERALLEKDIAARLAPLGLELTETVMTTRFFHYGVSDGENPCMDALIRAAKDASGRTLTPCGSCLSDLSVLLKYGSPRAFAFGIGRDFNAYGGSHQPDEHLFCENLLEYAKILGAFLLEYGK